MSIDNDAIDPAGGAHWGVHARLAAGDRLTVGNLRELGDEPAAILAVLRIYAAHGLEVVCPAAGMTLPAGLGEAARTWRVLRALAATAEPSAAPAPRDRRPRPATPERDSAVRRALLGTSSAEFRAATLADLRRKLDRLLAGLRVAAEADDAGHAVA